MGTALLRFIICDDCLCRLAQVLNEHAIVVEPGIRQTFISGGRLELTCPRCRAVTLWKIKYQAVIEQSETAG